MPAIESLACGDWTPDSAAPRSERVKNAVYAVTPAEAGVQESLEKAGFPPSRE